jgi:hypothetical protein
MLLPIACPAHLLNWPSARWRKLNAGDLFGGRFRRFSTLFGIMELDIDWADPPASRKEQSTRGRFYAAE